MNLKETLRLHALFLAGDSRGVCANLRSANLRSANLRSANLRSAILPPISIVPETGAFEGWKKLRDGIIARVCIPAKAGRVNSTGRKCRAEYVKVLEVFGAKQGVSQHDGTTTYNVGRIVRPDKYDPDFRVECSHGIHFFITRKEAEEY